MTTPKITLRELIARVDKSREAMGACSVLEELGIDQYGGFDHNGFDARLKEYWLAPWLCTDSWVGLSVLFLDDVPVATAMQTGRKMNKEYAWISPELREQTKAMCLSFATRPAEHFSQANLDEEMPPHYSVDYGEQLLVKTGTYQGEQVKVVNTRFPYSHSSWGKVEVELPTGAREVIDPAQLHLAYWVSP